MISFWAAFIFATKRQCERREERRPSGMRWRFDLIQNEPRRPRVKFLVGSKVVASSVLSLGFLN